MGKKRKKESGHGSGPIMRLDFDPAELAAARKAERLAQQKAEEAKQAEKEALEAEKKVVEAEEMIASVTHTDGKEWRCGLNEKGRVYYWNVQSKRTSWTLPENGILIRKEKDKEALAAAEAEAEAKKQKQQIWATKIDKKGRTFYYNIETKQTSWELPAGAKLKKNDVFQWAQDKEDDADQDQTMTDKVEKRKSKLPDANDDDDKEDIDDGRESEKKKKRKLTGNDGQSERSTSANGDAEIDSDKDAAATGGTDEEGVGSARAVAEIDTEAIELDEKIMLMARAVASKLSDLLNEEKEEGRELPPLAQLLEPGDSRPGVAVTVADLRMAVLVRLQDWKAEELSPLYMLDVLKRIQGVVSDYVVLLAMAEERKRAEQAAEAAKLAAERALRRKYEAEQAALEAQQEAERARRAKAQRVVVGGGDRLSAVPKTKWAQAQSELRQEDGREVHAEQWLRQAMANSDFTADNPNFVPVGVPAAAAAAAASSPKHGTAAAEIK